MFKITVNPDNSINEIFKVGRSNEIPEDAQEITDEQASELLAGRPTDYDFTSGNIVLNLVTVEARQIAEILPQKHAEIEAYYADKLNQYGVESLKELKLAAAVSNQPNRFTRALAFIDALNLEAMPRNVLERFDINSVPGKPDLS